MTAAPIALPSLSVNDKLIDCIVTTYDDRVFVCVTELPAFGTLIHASVVVHPDGAVEFSIKTLLGERDEDLYTLLARQVVERVHRTRGVPLLISVALRKPTEETIRAVLEHLDAAKLWSTD